MPCTISYVTRPHPDATRSRAAIAVDGDVQVVPVRGRGLHLEAAALIRALGASRRAGADVATTQVLLSSELHTLLTGPGAAPGRDTAAVRSVRGFLARYPYELVVGAAPDHVHAALPCGPAPDLTVGVDPDDLAWAWETGATIVFTDGSADSDEMVGAWSWYVDEDRHKSGPVPHLTTAFGAERYAVTRALADLDGPLLVLTDAWDLLIGADVYATTQHAENTLEADLEVRGGQVRVGYVKGHDACLGNLAADQLAQGTRVAAVAAVTSDEPGYRAHRAAVADLWEATAEHRARQQEKNDWFKARAREIIAAEHPDWHQLPKTDRTRLGRVMQLRMREEYNAAHADPADG